MNTIIETQWTVITGAPSSGKTSVVRALKERGMPCLPEPGTLLIESRLATGETLEEICADQSLLQREILEKGLSLQKDIPPDEQYFMDRSPADTIAYCRLYGIDTTYFLEQNQYVRYKNVFILDDLPFEKNHVRIENEQTANLLQQYLQEVYLDLGYTPIHIPRMSIDERVAYILHYTR